MSRIEIDEIVESLEGVVEYIGERTYGSRARVDESWEAVWTCLRDLARCVKNVTPALRLDRTPEELQWEERFRAMFPGEELPYPHREKIIAFHLSEIRDAVAIATTPEAAEREKT